MDATLSSRVSCNLGEAGHSTTGEARTADWTGLDLTWNRCAALLDCRICSGSVGSNNRPRLGGIEKTARLSWDHGRFHAMRSVGRV